MVAPFYSICSKQVLLNAYQQFNLNTKTILFIEPYGAVLSLLKHGFLKGFNIIILTANSDFRNVPQPILERAHLSIQVDTANEQAVLQVVNVIMRVIAINAVIPGFEYFVPVAASVNHLLGTQGIDCKDVMRLRRKDLMRSCLHKAGMKMPTFKIVSSIDDLKNAITDIGFPAVCKPIDAAGSVHVKRVDNEEQAIAAAQRILYGNDILWGYKISNVFLYEEYINGKELSLEGVVQNNQVIHFSITEKFVSDQIEFVEIGHIVNTPINHDLKRKIENYVEDVIKHLAIKNCPFHAEIRIDRHGQPILMEIAARLAGDRIGDLICLSRNINYFDYVYASYLNENCRLKKMRDDYAGIRFFYRPGIEKYSRVIKSDTINHHSIEELSLYYKQNEAIPSFPKPLSRLGHVILKSKDYHYLLSALNEIDNGVQFY